jgi:hypothetical protein
LFGPLEREDFDARPAQIEAAERRHDLAIASVN